MPLTNTSVLRTVDPSGDKFLMKLLLPDLKIQTYVQVDENGDVLGVTTNPVQVNDNAVLLSLASVLSKLDDVLTELQFKFNTTDTLSVVPGALGDAKTSQVSMTLQNTDYALPSNPKTGRKLLIVSNNNASGFAVLGNNNFINTATTPPVGVKLDPGHYIVLSAAEDGVWFARGSVAGLQLTVTEQS